MRLWGRGASELERNTGPTSDTGGLLKHVAGFVIVAALLATAQFTGVLRPLADGLAALRFDVAARNASQTLTVVEIDPLSLRAAGQWPWGRDRFARAINNLEAAGAEAVAFDVDFSATSSPAADKALAQVIEQRPGAVVLPTFVQTLSSSPANQLVETSPLQALSAGALLASVNVPLDADGRERRYRYGFGEGAAYRPTMGSILAGGAPQRTGSFLIDYGIRPQSIARLSFQDVYTGRFDPRLVKGRKILIGATAQELGDKFATPRRGVLPGVYVHALAYESILQGRDLRTFKPVVTLLLALWCAYLLRPGATLELRKMLRRHLAVAAISLLAPMGLQALAPVSADLSAVLFAQMLCLVWLVRVELDRRERAIIRERETGLLHLALHEPETELPNRRALLREIARRLQAPDQGRLGVLAVGIDRFASMRGAIGYHRFNEVVRQVAARICEATGETFVAHLSTSVIGVVVTAESRKALIAKVNRVTRLDPWLSIEGLSVDAFVRTGVAYRRRGSTKSAETLLEHASIALDRARETDSRSVTYDPRSFPDPSINIALMGDMVRGLKSGEFSVHYQPKIAVDSGEIRAAEALVRWTHPVRGTVSPELFVATAEETGMIRALTDWCVATTVADVKALAAAGHHLSVAVNVSAALLTDVDFRRSVLKAVSGCESRLVLEITESAIIRNPAEALEAIAAFRAAGLRISIDDYGSGLSSLAYLKTIQADELKIDKSLVATLEQSARDRLIIKSTIDLAHSLGMTVVAEGVETEHVFAALRTMGCDLAQGWLFSKAVPIERLKDALGAGVWAPARAVA